MSTNLLILIPAEPTYRPASVFAEQAQDLLKKRFPQTAEVSVSLFEEVEFIATGGNLERIRCPCCQSVLDEQWWIAAMERAYNETRFADLTVTLPCCGRVSSLNDLHYEWPAGFARFQLHIRDPSHEIDEATFQELERILVCSLRKIWTHF
ncbi:MAG TPA: hypothetical protein VFV38_52495 [Ktedonobacteraceae bacterium]|nr:hypothetical protein [Ktedonobacteraceae bacterium]